ncbi:MAG: hypothetical protein BWY15_00703 [Firmicutes bacterium ADurb.Bin193]|nr:MAG: hypothetical protein BWY15_00703 [Firmicutes bacterium ADurb.Bin193]
MKTTRMIIGIISIVLFAVIAFQSCAAGLGNALEENNEMSGSAGFFLALCMLIAGVIAVAAKKSRGGAATAGGFYLIGGIIGIVNVGGYSDLQIWSIVSFAFAVVFIVGAILQKKETKGEKA